VVVVQDPPAAGEGVLVRITGMTTSATTAVLEQRGLVERRRNF